MVDPMYLIVIALGSAFSLGLLKKAGVFAQTMLTLIALGGMTLIATQWTFGLLAGGVQETALFTAGLKPPFSIHLFMGQAEAILLLVVNMSALLSTLLLTRNVKHTSTYMLMLILVFVMGLNGVILTRDLFNMFVFIEIISIASAGLIAIHSDLKQLSAGFKFILAGALASGFLLLGIIFTYYTMGSLNIDVIAANMSPALMSSGFVGLFLVFIGIMIELKPFPVNGWGIDAYEASVPGVSAMVSAGTTTAMFYAFVKIMNMTGGMFNEAAAVIGALTFIGMNVVALRQEKVRRLLGYSSISQVGLMVLSYALLEKYQVVNSEFIVLGLLVSHAFAKALLFWLSDIVHHERIEEWGSLRKLPLFILSFGVAICALVGLPPFPSFFAKFDLIMALAEVDALGWIGIILGGTLIEAVYLFRWFGFALKNCDKEKESLIIRIETVTPVAVNMFFLFVLGYASAQLSPFANTVNWWFVGFILLLMALEWLPAWTKNIVVMGAVTAYGIPFIQSLTGYHQIFGSIFAVGALITLIPGFVEKGQRQGFYPSVAMMFAGLIGIIEATDMLAFFFSWELMTLGSYFLILRGKKSKPHALSYMLFSLGGAYLILTGFGLTYAEVGTGSIALNILSEVAMAPQSGLIFLLLSVGFMTKLASGGLHIWLPGAHAEAEGDVSPMVSGILLKAGVFGLLMTFIALGDQSIGKVNIPYVLGWLGAITALSANYMAAMQEDAKRLLAYSSIGQMGYALFGLSLMSHLGWLAAISLSIVHFTYKVLLFLAIGGVVYRVKTKKMYEMGGLIKRMPITFTVVLISIIALSGIPPLAGFSGRWITYNAVLQKGWLLQGAVVGVSGLIAFLYLFRLIFSIFLGQLKDAHRKVKEAPLPYLIPQVLLIGLVMYLSMAPGAFLRPIGEIVNQFHTEGALQWRVPGQGFGAVSDYGYWNGVAVMWVFMTLFAANFLILLVINRGAQKIKQFNIVFAAERPARPETTHFAYNFFAPYRKAVGFLEYPITTKFWDSVSDLLHSIAGFVRRVYTGNGQTYLIQIMIFVIITFLLTNGGK